MNAVFAVGDRVAYIDRPNGAARRFTVVKVMPVENAVHTYRIRDDAERFERAVPGSSLTRIASTPKDRLFGN